MDYAIGDVQGCYGPLQDLLGAIAFDPARDRVWLVGDLVNRGPDSLAVLRWAKAQGRAVVAVLGNHDLHLLAVACGAAPAKTGDTLAGVLNAPDREELLDWLRGRPLLYREGDYCMVHAGLLPAWTAADAARLAREVEAELRGPHADDFFRAMYGNAPARWEDRLRGAARTRVVVNAMTRLRVLQADGSMELGFKGPPAELPAGLTPWFDAPGRRSRDVTVVCGHWSALGLVLRDDVLALDTGCLWGRRLTAVRLSDRRVFGVDCPRAGRD